MGAGTLGDHQTLVRDGFRMILDAQEDIEVVGEAADGLEAIAKAHELGAVALPPEHDSDQLCRASKKGRRAVNRRRRGIASASRPDTRGAQGIPANAHA